MDFDSIDLVKHGPRSTGFEFRRHQAPSPEAKPAWRYKHAKSPRQRLFGTPVKQRDEVLTFLTGLSLD